MSLDAGTVYATLGGKFNPEGFTAFDSATKQAAANAESMEKRSVAAQTRMGQAASRLTQFTQRGAQASRDAALAEQQHAVKIAETESKMSGLERTIRSTGVATKLQSAEMGLLTKQHENLSAALTDSSAKTSMFSKYSDQAGKNLKTIGSVATKGAVIGLVAVAAATGYAVSKTVTFNAEMLKSHTQAGLTMNEVNNLSKSVLKLAGTVPQSPNELAQGLYHLASAGYKGTQAMELLKASSEGAALGGADLQDTTQALIAATASHIKGVHGAADAMGQLNAIVGVGDMRMEQLAKGMAQGILPAAAEAGLSLKDVGAAMATVTDNATPANVVATRLRMTIALMAAPSAAATKQLESIGLKSTSLAHDMRQPNGLLKAIEDLKTHLKDSGKTAEEQDAVLTKVFGGGKSSAVIQTLVAETDRLRTKYQQLGETNGPQRLAASWADFQKSSKAQFGELKSSAEVFAISIGTVVLPELSKLAKAASTSLRGFMNGGGAEKVGTGITSVFDTISSVVTGLAPDIEFVAKALFDVGKALNLGNPAELETLITVFGAFKAASFVLPIIATGLGAVAEGVALVGAAVSEGELMALPALLLSLADPVTAIAAGLGLLAGGFVAMQSGLFSSTTAAEKNAAAMQKDTDAIKGLHEATDGAADAHFAAAHAVLAHTRAVDNLKSVEKSIKDGTLKGADAQRAMAEALLEVSETAHNVTQAHEASSKAIDKETKQAEKIKTLSLERRKELFGELRETEKQIKLAELHGSQQFEMEPLEKKRIKQQQEINQALKEGAQAEAVAAVAEESRRRIAAGKSAVSAKNAEGVQNLQESLEEIHAPKKLVTKYELDDQNAQAKLGQLSQKLMALGQKTTVAKILTTAPSAGAAVEAMKAIVAGIPTSKVLTIFAHSSSAAEAIEAIKALINGVPLSKVIHILTTAPSAQAGVAALKNEISMLQDKQVTVTTVIKTIGHIVSDAAKGVASLTGHASGRGSGDREVALTGEEGNEYIIDRRTGKGTVVTSPTLMSLGPDDYVIPTENHKGRALDLYLSLTKDLGMPAFAKGKAPAKKGKAKDDGHAHWKVPGNIDPLSLPVEDIEKKQSNAEGTFSKAKSALKTQDDKVKSLEKQMRNEGESVKFTKSALAKAHARSKLSHTQKELFDLKRQQQKDLTAYNKDRKAVDNWKKTSADAKKYQALINQQTSEVNIAANSMKLAAGRDDKGGYEKAQGERVTHLKQLQKLIGNAESHVKVDTEYSRTLLQQVQNAELEQQQTEGEEFKAEANPAQEREESTGMTDAEQAQLKSIEKAEALAALTPGLGDDEAAAQSLIGFLTNVLGETQAEPEARGGDASITNIAQQLQTARNNLEAFTKAGTQNENADLQAQITQANERAESSAQSALIAEQALSVFSGSGDLGAGGRNAAQAAAGVTQNIYTLHPGDPATLSAIGAAATSGMAYQGSRRTVRVPVGP